MSETLVTAAQKVSRGGAMAGQECRPYDGQIWF